MWFRVSHVFVHRVKYIYIHVSWFVEDKIIKTANALFRCEKPQTKQIEHFCVEVLKEV